MVKAATWADGFGRWHAVVADTPRGLTNAVNAMADEIGARSNQSIEEVRAYVHRNIVSDPTHETEPGFIHFAEYALADD